LVAEHSRVPVTRAILGWALALTACASVPVLPPGTSTNEESFARQEQVEPYVPWKVRRERHRTQLAPARRPATPTVPLSPPVGAQLVRYTSGSLELGAWYAGVEASQRAPGVVYLHNDFDLREEAWRNARAFVDAGFAVLLPALRGENGNPGERELLYGEVDDARAAVAWLATQPGVDPDRIYVIGHSIGGGVASLLALDPPTQVRATADIGGIYRAHTFHRWAVSRGGEQLVRFDLQDDEEVSLRVFIAHLRDLSRPHYTFAGRGDPFDTRYAQLAARRAEGLEVPFHFVAVDGDHTRSARYAVEAFIAIIRADGADSMSTRD
jgi:pimeloyl-ACP methyl ester carboxylesterase